VSPSPKYAEAGWTHQLTASDGIPRCSSFLGRAARRLDPHRAAQRRGTRPLQNRSPLRHVGREGSSFGSPLSTGPPILKSDYASTAHDDVALRAPGRHGVQAATRSGRASYLRIEKRELVVSGAKHLERPQSGYGGLPIVQVCSPDKAPCSPWC
jgi:hypothetical protein